MNANWSDELLTLDRVGPSRDLWADVLARTASRSPARFRIVRPTLLVGPVLVAVTVAVAALALVPVGGASLGARAVNGINSLWETPPNQSALDRAADDAQSIAGGAYFTAAAVDDAANTVHLYLVNAPQPIIDQLNAAHPATYEINNHAAHPLSQLLRVQHALPFGFGDPLQTSSGAVYVLSSYPTVDGYLKVGIQGHDVQDAQSALESMYGSGIIEVFGGAQVENGLVYHG